jgi:Helicase conserved C-terminal domain
MEKINLPRILPGSCNLEQLNEKIIKKQVSLDWSRVKKAQRSDLVKLLSGVRTEDPDYVTDILGLDDENIAPPILELLEDILSPKNPTPYQLRQEFQDALYRDLLGPVNGEYEEVLTPSNILDRYLLGVIAPKIRQKQDSELKEQDDESTAILLLADNNSEEGNSEPNNSLSNSLYPSSFGLTFSVERQVKAIQITACWGQYQRVDSEIYFNDNGNPKRVWQRQPIKKVHTISLDNEKSDQWNIEADIYSSFKLRKSGQGDWIITVFLVNGQKETKENRASSWLFQPELIINSADSDFPYPFIRKPLPKIPELDSLMRGELEQMNMLYRKQVEFAVGHGVSVKVGAKFDNRTNEVRTTFIPRYEVPRSDFPDEQKIPELKGLVLDMELLAQSDSSQLQRYLAPLPKAYRAWLELQQQQIPLLELEYQQSAQNALNKCQESLSRLEKGILLLEQDPDAFEAFRLMNQAMSIQRSRSLYAERTRRGEKASISNFDLPKFRTWRLFQLAFILINLPGLSDVHHGDRAICDLLWFATGGGKTEAYLGLTAYTLGIRRLQKGLGYRDGEKGVAVIMRYTLRLLTLQQFQRATTLICALEVIRQQDPNKWGQEPFRIGLWVGQNTTPNRTEQSEEYIRSLPNKSNDKGTGSPHQLTNCPWCGSRIKPEENLKVESFAKGRARTLVYCSDPQEQCPFSFSHSPSEGLPIVVVDEEIYRLLPSLLISTVDKFARLPWQGEVQMLFGQVNGYCQRHGFRSGDTKDEDSHRKSGNLPAATTTSHLLLRPPDLIIQDELHLISGPLGTLVGIYETAVDELSSWQVEGQKVQPKVIASTATIRQAAQQVQSIFNRQVEVFPPQAIDIEDNFFSYQITPSAADPGRLYLGICAPGRRMKATIIRIYLAALSAGQLLYEKHGKSSDPWMTLVGYFNSLRELGGTRRLVDDDIRTRLGQMKERDLANRRIVNFDELTSRKDSTEIPILLDQLEVPFDPESTDKKPLDVILATNMLSVGVDVKRLGLMVVCGQPKTTSEYIQATSRVGRNFPGLVITLYNWARPRDLSHFESFEHYHATFYKQVEALSVTPFSYGSLDRALAALLVTLVRHKGNEFNQNNSPGRLSEDHPYVKAAFESILNRARVTQSPEVCEYIAKKLETLLQHWLEEAGTRIGGATLCYQLQNNKGGTSIPLLQNAGQERPGPFACLNSLRNVEPGSQLILSDKTVYDEPDRIPQKM